MATFPVVIDSCVLFNAPVRDTLLRAAEYGLYRAHWSSQILAETTKNLIECNKMNNDKAKYLVTQMEKAFPEAMIDVPQSLIDAMRNSAKDKHVAACAVRAAAQVICTTNLKDFKPETLSEWNIEAQHPDQILCYLVDLWPDTLMSVLIEQAQDLRDINLDKLLSSLSKHVPKFVECITKQLNGGV